MDNYQNRKVCRHHNRKLISILGDSISTLNGYNPLGYRVFFDGDRCREAEIGGAIDTWWGKVIDFIGGELLVNNSWSGSRVTSLPGSDTLFPSGCSDERTSMLHTAEADGVRSTPDIIIVYLGTNDWAYGVPLTVNTQEKKECFGFHSAYGLMLEKIHRNYPDAIIWCCSLVSTYMSKDRGFDFPYCYAGTHIEDFNESIKKNVDVFRERTGCRICYLDLYSYHIPYDSLDGSHPNRSGMDTLARLIMREVANRDRQTFMDCPEGTHEYSELGWNNGIMEYVCKKCARKSLLKTQWTNHDSKKQKSDQTEKENLTGLTIGGRYKIEDIIIHGGIAVTYRGVDICSGEWCTIKAIHTDSLYRIEAEKIECALRFESRLRHPGINGIKGIYEEKGYLFVIKGGINIDGEKTLFDVRRRRGISAQEILSIANQMAEILSYLHSLNPPVIHRCADPSNWVLDRQGKLYLTNFGSAMNYFRFERDRDELFPFEIDRADGSVSDIEYGAGVRGFNAPEIFAGRSEPASDIYSMGATLYFLMTGMDPSKAPYQIFPLWRFDNLPVAFYGLESIIGKCTKLNPRERYQNGTEILRDLSDWGQVAALVSQYGQRFKMRVVEKTGKAETEKFCMIVDSIEETSQFRDVVQKAERKTQLLMLKHGKNGRLSKNRRLFWSTKKEILFQEYNIDWFSPAELNPFLNFEV